MPRRPPRSVGAPSHVAGDHALFHSASTAKRFPLLAKVPQQELAVMFNVPPPDPAAQEQEDLMFSEPFNDKAYTFRPTCRLPEEQKPFLPADGKPKELAASAAALIRVPEEQLLPAVAQSKRLEATKLPPFRYGNVAEAQHGIQSNYYMYSLDEATAKAVADRTRRRIRNNLARLAEEREAKTKSQAVSTRALMQ